MCDTEIEEGADLLDRQAEILNLTSIVLDFNYPIVLAIDAPWGSGKTTFVRLWQDYLKQQSMQSIYFNAWETDFADDPLVVLVSELDKWLKSTKNDPIITKWQKGLKKAFPSVLKRTAVVGTKLATLGALDISAEYERALADYSEKIADELLVNFNKQKKSIDEFKAMIGVVLEALPKNQKNLVIFIDELDRCRPTYAIELLERIKHLFGIEKGLVFVLSTDTTQLSHSIRAVYGNDFDAKKYLQRFINLDYQLKKPNPQKYLDKRFESLELNKILSSKFGIVNLDLIKNCFSVLIKKFTLTARDINMLLLRFHLILFSSKQNNIDVALLISLLILRDLNKSKYDQYTESPSIADEVINFLFAEKLFNGKSNDAHAHALAYMIGSLIASNQHNPLEFDRLIQPYRKKTDNPLDYNYQLIVSYAENKRSASIGQGFSHMLTIERIELVHQMSISA